MKYSEVISELKSASEWFAAHGKNTNTAIIGICDRAVELINIQKSEIEKLQRHNKEYKFCNLLENALVYTKTLEDYNNLRKAFKSEAIKEFWQRLKKESEIISGGDYGFIFEIREDEGDNLVKEMMESK